ncbi:hypothetical protein [Clostridium amazonitimonense]|uniref:hypothetical protein n=1 Tax=Clostridium amazonitimonense TaxID=1499689 RepID=UPI000509FE8E|nr:hypothetical protein [Clostridium amazonitimonense]
MSVIQAMLTGLLWMNVGLVIKYLFLTNKLPKESVELLKASYDNIIVVYLNYYASKKKIYIL